MLRLQITFKNLNNTIEINLKVSNEIRKILRLKFTFKNLTLLEPSGHAATCLKELTAEDIGPHYFSL